MLHPTGCFGLHHLLLVSLVCMGCLTACGGADPGSGGELDAGSLCAADVDCQDGVFCNGIEACSPSSAAADARGCIPSEMPACLSGQECVESSASCSTQCETTSDADGDGRAAIACGGDDCDDADPNRFPGNVEVCDPSGHDEDCDPSTFGFRDQDGDGAADASCCNGVLCGPDCDDNAPSVNPTASEVCDGFDNNCNGDIDEGVTQTFFVDADGDGFGDPTMAVAAACGEANDLADNALDCDDSDASIRPGVEELCDGRDTNCDGVREPDVDQDGHLEPDAPCTGGPLPKDDCNDLRASVFASAPERCDGIDNDCDDDIDERAATGAFCRSDARVDSAFCVDLECEVSACAFGFGDCDGVGSNGCEVDTRSDADHCGACGVACAFGQDCVDGTCARPVVTGLSAGDAHTCAVLDNGTALCWGSNDQAQLGEGTVQARNGPVAVAGVDDAVQITAGRDHTCALSSTGRVSCWGRNRSGQVDGTRFTEQVFTPFDNGAPDAVSTFSTGDGQGVVTAAGNVVEWGDSWWEEGFRATPEAVEIGTVRAIDGGLLRRCFVDATGSAFCEGAQFAFQTPAGGTLGDGVSDHGQTCAVGPFNTTVPGFADCTASPAQVLGLSGLQDITVGEVFSCAHDGMTLSCWGLGDEGQIGDGGGVSRSTPVVALTGAITAMEAGRSHACAIVDGGVRCWGSNSDGQAGGTGDTLSPAAIPGLDGARGLATGDRHSCAIDAAGDVLCWGRGTEGQLGNGSETSRETPQLVRGLDPLVSIAVGDNTSCARRASGELWCTGDRMGSQQLERFTEVSGATDIWPDDLGCVLGDEGLVCWERGGEGVPVVFDEVADVVEVSGGSLHRCARSAAGAVHCWGRGANGRLGDGSGEDRSDPVPVAGLSDAIDIDTGSGFTCAVRRNGRVACWGAGADGQLGDGLARDQPVPVDVLGIDDAVEVAAGGLFACARHRSGDVSCWGFLGTELFNEPGGLGDAEATPRSPVPIRADVSDVVDLTAGNLHVCTIAGGGGVTCWGINRFGVLGISPRPDGRNGSTPQAIQGLQARAIEAGVRHTCVLTTQNELACWGQDEDGQVGVGPDNLCSISVPSVGFFDTDCDTNEPRVAGVF